MTLSFEVIKEKGGKIDDCINQATISCRVFAVVDEDLTVCWQVVLGSIIQRKGTYQNCVSMKACEACMRISVDVDPI